MKVFNWASHVSSWEPSSTVNFTTFYIIFLISTPSYTKDDGGPRADKKLAIWSVTSKWRCGLNKNGNG